MVPLTFKTVYLFLALFALPQVLAAPGASALGPRDSILDDALRNEAISLHNDFRAARKLPGLTWNLGFSFASAVDAFKCQDARTDPQVFKNVKVANSITEAFKSWTSNTGSREYSLITGRAITKFGCGVQKCDGRLGVVCRYGLDE